MGLLDRLRSWFGGGTDTEEPVTEDDSDESPDTTGLDPENVTEVRAEGSDDAAAKLRDLSDREEESPDE